MNRFVLTQQELLAVLARNKRIYYLTQFLHALIFTIPIWIVYYQKFVTVPQLSILVTIEYITQMVFEVPSGAIADIIGRRTANFIAYGIGTIRYFLYPFASDFNFFLILSLLGGISDSFRSGSEEALVYDTYKQAQKEDEFPSAYAHGNVFYQVGLILATALGGILYEIHASIPYVSYGVSLLIGTIVICFYSEPIIDTVKFNLRNYGKQMVYGMKEAFKDTYTKFLSFFYIFVGGIGWACTIYFNEFMMVELGFSNTVRGYLIAAMRLINVVIITRLLNDKHIFTFSRTIIFFPVVMTLALLPGRSLEGIWGVPFVQGAMIATTARWIILAPLTNAAFSSKYRATAISMLSLAIGVVYILLTSASAIIIDNYGIKTMYSVLGIVTLITVVPIAITLLAIKRSEVSHLTNNLLVENSESF